MILLIAGRELRESVRDGRLFGTSVLLAVVLGATLWTGWRDYAAAMDHAARLQRAERERWLRQGSKSPHSAAHFGQFVMPPRLPLSMLDRGVSSYVGSFLFLEAHTQKLFRFRPAEDRAAAARFGEPTVAWALQVLVPLLMTVLLAPALAREREQRTLPQLLAAGVAPRSIVLGKALGLVVPVMVPLALLVTVTAALLMATGASPSQWLRAVVLTACYGLYGLTCGALALVVSVQAHSARRALVAGLSGWFMACFLLPPVLTALAAAVAPAPDALRFAGQVQSDRQTLPVWYDRLDGTEKRLLARYRVSSLRELPVSPAGLAMVEDEEAYDRLQARRFGHLYGQLERQNRLYQFGGLVTPLAAVQSASMALAGTDFLAYRHFAQAAEMHRQYFVQAMNRAMIHGQRPDALPYSPGYAPGGELWRSVHGFRYGIPGASWAIANALPGMAILLGWALLSVLLLLRTTRELSPS